MNQSMHLNEYIFFFIRAKKVSHCVSNNSPHFAADLLNSVESSAQLGSVEKRPLVRLFQAITLPLRCGTD